MLGKFIMEGINSKSVRVNGSDIRYFEHGAGEGKPQLLLISGWPSSALILSPLMRELGGRYHCIAIDLPGYGRSESLVDTPHTLDSFGSVLNKFCEAVIPVEKVEIFGYSLGGALALNFAASHPQLVERLTVYSSPYNGIALTQKNDSEDKPLDRVYKFLWERPRLLRALDIRWLKQAFWHLVFRLVYTKRYPKINKLGKPFVKEVLIETSYMDLPRMFEYPLDFAETDLSDMIRNITIPVVVLSGTEDLGVLSETSLSLSELIPQGRFVPIADADHAAPYTDSLSVARAITDNYSKR